MSLPTTRKAADEAEARVQLVACDTPKLRLAVYAFRYRIYVEAMRRRQSYADHARRLVQEPMDVEGRNYAALIGDEVVATIRANRADDPAAQYYRRLYRLDSMGVRDLNHIQITTKLMVRSDLRRTTLGARLLAFYGGDSVRRDMRVDVMDCNAPLIPMFERFGYHSYCGWVFHREFGTVRAMFAAGDTLRWFRAIGSPLHRAAAPLIADNCFDGYALIRRIAIPPLDPALGAAFQNFFR